MKECFYAFYVNLASLPLSVFLLLFRWKRKTIALNAKICGFSPSFSFFFRLYFNISRDFVRFLHGKHHRLIFLARKDRNTLERLKTNGSILVAAHFHNWEMMGGWLVESNVNLLTSERPFKSRWAEAILKRLRKSHGISTVSEHIPRSALKHIRSGSCFAVIWDQYSPHAKERVSLFGVPAAMDPLPAFLAQHCQAPVFMAVLLPSGRLRLFQLQAALSGPVDGARLARKYHRVLEGLIRRYPSYWYGFTHGRFKETFSYVNTRRSSTQSNMNSKKAFDFAPANSGVDY